MPREDPRPQQRNISYQDMMLPRNKGHGPVLCYRGNKEISRLLTLYYSEVTSREQAKEKGSKTVRSQDKPFVCRRERVKINRNCSRTFSFNDKNGFVC